MNLANNTIPRPRQQGSNNEGTPKRPKPTPSSQLPSLWMPPFNSTIASVASMMVEKDACVESAGCCVSHLLRVPHDDDGTKSKNKNAHLHQSCDDVLSNKFQSYLQSPAFIDFCTSEGIVDPSITILCQKSSLWEQFVAQVEKDVAGGASIELGVVFHGTAKDNIESILKSGLDPKRRSGQAYGVGEYFSKNPTTSLSYCKGGNKVLVFCVVIPSKSHVIKPQDFVIVEKTQHQVPIATLEFSGASVVAMMRSQDVRSQLQRLNQAALQADAAAKEAEMKAKIIQLLFQNELQSAAHKFRGFVSFFSATSKLEISYWAHQHADAEFCQFYFGNELPLPPDWNTFQKDIVSVEAQQAKLQKARANVTECQENLKTEVAGSTTSVNSTFSSLGMSSSGSSSSASSSLFTLQSVAQDIMQTMAASRNQSAATGWAKSTSTPDFRLDHTSASGVVRDVSLDANTTKPHAVGLVGAIKTNQEDDNQQPLSSSTLDDTTARISL